MIKVIISTEFCYDEDELEKSLPMECDNIKEWAEISAKGQLNTQLIQGEFFVDDCNIEIIQE